MNNFLESVLSSGVVADGIMASDTKHMKEIWKLRETCAEALVKAGKCYKYDISLPLENFYEIVQVMSQRLVNKALVCGYGHVGDGNLVWHSLFFFCFGDV